MLLGYIKLQRFARFFCGYTAYLTLCMVCSSRLCFLRSFSNASSRTEGGKKKANAFCNSGEKIMQIRSDI